MTIEVLDIERLRELQTHLIGEHAVFFALKRCVQQPLLNLHLSESHYSRQNNHQHFVARYVRSS